MTFNSTLPLNGRRALVTGSATGIGRATALRLAVEGAAVCVNDVIESKALADAARGVAAYGRPVAAAAGDVGNEADVTRIFDHAEQRLGGAPDLVVNNAGIDSTASLLEMETREWTQVLAVNLTGAFLCTREAARRLVRDGLPGTVINVSSVHEEVPWPGHSHYCASKAGLRLFARSIARELAPHRIRVAAVAPGTVETEMTAAILRDDRKRARLERQIPWGRIASPEEIAAAVAWVAGPDADYLVGTTVFVDGGLTLGQR
jgi:glucose 1-dehydrogenase